MWVSRYVTWSPDALHDRILATRRRPTSVGEVMAIEGTCALDAT